MKIKGLHIIGLLLLLHTQNSLWAQDLHFSQFNLAPVALNPALAGQFPGDFRFAANQRTQWNSVTTPYQTFSLSAEMKNAGIRNLNLALLFMYDQAGDSRLRTQVPALSISYDFPINRDSSHFLSLGGEASGHLQNISYSNLYFDEQFTGNSFKPELSSGEVFDQSQINRFNLGAGLVHTWQINREEQLLTGFSAYHLLDQSNSWLNQEGLKLNKRYTFFSQHKLPLNNKNHLLSRILYSKQGKLQELILGATYQMEINSKNPDFKGVFSGLYFRNRDAGYINFGAYYGNWTFSMSYDINVSKLIPASHGRGGFEFALIYILKRYRPDLSLRRICPDYL